MLNDKARHPKKGGNWLQFSHKILASMDCMAWKVPQILKLLYLFAYDQWVLV
jgi:hypothetical protein